jgi:SpoIIAA-like
MLELIGGFPKNVVGIAASGKVTMQDCRDVLVPAIEKSRKWHDKIRLYYEINSRFPGSAWEDLDLGLEHASCCERVAIVTDIGWVRLTVKAVRFLIPARIQVFSTEQAEDGRAWITALPGSRADIDVSPSARPGLPRPRRVRRPSRVRTVGRLARQSQRKRRTSQAMPVDQVPIT